MGIKASDPIGIFDSGIGGLTVAHAIKERLPGENLIYFGDTAHLPYGDKSTAAIQAYSIKICDVLLRHNCKVILIACNSASAAAYELVKEYVGSKAKVMNVIDPVINYLRENLVQTKVGLIGTKQTILSGVYAKKVKELEIGIELTSLATPLLVPMIEEGFFKNQISQDILNEYLNREELSGIKALILGCTHYPLIKTEIQNFYRGRIRILDSSEIVAAGLKGLLDFHHLQNSGSNHVDQFMVSDYTEAFQSSTQMFFQESVKLESHRLWE